MSTTSFIHARVSVRPGRSARAARRRTSGATARDALPRTREPQAAEVWPTELDTRGAVEPPKHVPAILVEVAALAPGRLQYVRTRERPAELLAALEARGVEAKATQMPDRSWQTRIVGPDHAFALIPMKQISCASPAR